MKNALTPQPDSPAAGPESRVSEDGSCCFGLAKEKMLLLAGDLFLIGLLAIPTIYLLSNGFRDLLHLRTAALAATIVLYPPALYVFDLYNIERLFNWRDVVVRTTLAVILICVLSGALLSFFDGFTHLRISMVNSLCVLIFIIIWRRIYRSVVRTAFPPIPAVVVAAGPSQNLIKDLSASPLFPYEIKASASAWAKGRITTSDTVGFDSNITELLRNAGARRAILAIPSIQRYSIARDMVEARFEGTVIEEMATVYEQLTGRVPVQYIEDHWLSYSDGFDILHKRHIQRIKRIMDLAVSGVLLILTSPLALAAMPLIKLSSRGPVLYRQKRVGKDDAVFTMLKFRSMRVDAEASGIQWASKDDSRTTAAGKWLRRYRVDEIPQLWNVIKGDMSVVGPRPERPEWVSLLERQVPYYRLRHRVKPGVTGWAQVTFRYGASLEDAVRKLESDLYYIKNMSLFFDFKRVVYGFGKLFRIAGL